jgi:N-acetylneuraminic acid mutarotase
MSTQPTTRRTSAWVLIAVVLLLAAIVGVVLFGSGILDPPESADASPTPTLVEPATPSASASASASAIASATPAAAVEAAWTVTGELDVQRLNHTATLLPDGAVLVAGGSASGGESLASATLYHPESGTWTAAADMGEQRAVHSATPLTDGRVLVAGGIGMGFPTGTTLASAELYDPASRTWTATGDMGDARSGQAATLLADGTVLVTSGGTAEIYDPEAGTWSPTGNLSSARDGHTATLLSDGRVLAAGGRAGGGTDFESAELYDPSTGTWTVTGDMTEVRVEHSATLLPDGTVLVAGGTSLDPSATAEVYDPGSGTWSATGSMVEARFSYAATLLADGRVLAAGGFGVLQPEGSNYVAAAELYDSASRTWTSTVSMSVPRFDPVATLLEDGTVLVTGGDGAGAVVERYQPASGS